MFKLYLVKGKGNHLTDVLSRNPVLHPTNEEVKACKNITLIPDIMIITPTLANEEPSKGIILSMMTQLPQVTSTLAHQVCSAQVLPTDYEHVRELHQSLLGDPNRGYVENSRALYHHGVWWVTPGCLQEQVIVKGYNSLAANTLVRISRWTSSADCTVERV